MNYSQQITKLIKWLSIVVTATAAVTACHHEEGVGNVDITPDAFDFTNQTEVTFDTVVQSNRVTLTGFGAQLDTSLSGDASAAYSICDAPTPENDQSACDADANNFATNDRKILPGQSVRIRLTSGNSLSESTSATLTLSTPAGAVVGSATFTVTTESQVDTAPNQFTFTDQTGLNLNEPATSAALTITGINSAAAISISGDASATYRVGGTGSFTNAAGTINNGETVEVQITTAGTLDTAVSATVTIGGVSDDFVARTATDLDIIAPNISIVFPSTDGLLTDGDTVILRGTADDDNDGNGVADVSVRVGAQAAVAATDTSGDSSFSTWQVTLPGLAMGNNTITATADDNFNTADATVDLVRYPLNSFRAPDNVVVDTANSRIVVVNSDNQLLGDNLVAIDLTAGGAPTVLSNDNTGTGDLFGDPRALAVNAAGDTAYVADEGLDAILSVNLANGNRTILSQGGGTPTGSGPDFLQPRGMVLDAANSRLIVVDAGVDALIGVNLANGDRTILSDSATPVGTGTAFDNPFGIALSGTTAYVADQNLAAILQVDLTNGNRTDLSNATTPNTNNPFTNPKGIALDGNRLLVADNNLDQIIAVDLVTTPGDRTVFSDNTTDLDARMRDVAGLTIDAANGRALAVDTAYRRVLAIDLTTGARTVLGGRPTRGGTAVPLMQPRKMTVDAANNRLLVPERAERALFDMHWITGVRTLIADNPTTGGPDFTGNLVDVTLNTASGVAAVINDGGAPSVVTVDLGTGTKTLLSNNSTPSGANPFATGGDGTAQIVYDADNTRYLVGRANNSGRHILGVDPSTGARVVAYNNTGTSPTTLNYNQPKHMALDEANDILYVLDQAGSAKRIHAQPLAGTPADRYLISDNGIAGSGDDIKVPRGFALDSGNNRLLVCVRDNSPLPIEGIIAVDIASGNRAFVTRSDDGPAPGSALNRINAVDECTSVALSPTDGLIFVGDGIQDSIMLVDTVTGHRLRFSQ